MQNCSTNGCVFDMEHVPQTYNMHLEWQVSLPVVRRFVQSISDQAVGTGLIRGVRPDQQMVKVWFISISVNKQSSLALIFSVLWPIFV